MINQAPLAIELTQFQIHQDRMRSWARLWLECRDLLPTLAEQCLQLAIHRRNLRNQSARVAEQIDLRQGGAVVAREAHNLEVAGSNPAPDPNTATVQPIPAVAGLAETQPGGILPLCPPASSSEIQRLAELFETHGGFLPGRELTAEGFDVRDLAKRGLIAPPASHLDGGCYLIGSELRKAVQRV